MSRITLLTDFGTADGYVGAMKGAIAEIAPSVLIDDISHAIAPGDIISGAFAVRRYWDRYPEGTAHVVVIDPGVGTDRRALMIEADGRYLIGPDNGVFTFVLNYAGDVKCYELVADDVASRTFHGRDLFAPAAARIINGDRAMVGDEVGDAIRVIFPRYYTTDASVRGEIINIDRFGNLISNVPGHELKDGMIARVKDRDVCVVGTYGDVEPGEVLCLINSDGMLEIAVRNGSAAVQLHVERGETFELLQSGPRFVTEIRNGEA